MRNADSNMHESIYENISRPGRCLQKMHEKSLSPTQGLVKKTKNLNVEIFLNLINESIVKRK